MGTTRTRNEASSNGKTVREFCAFHEGDRVSVLLPLPLGGTYDYVVPPGLNLGEGDFITVPLGSREVNGVVWGPGDWNVDARKLRPVMGRHDLPPLSADARAFIEWVAAYTLAPTGAVLRMAMSVRSVLSLIHI